MSACRGDAAWTNRDRARLFRGALAKGYAEYCRVAAMPTQLERLSRRFDRIGFLAGVTWISLFLPWFSQLWWSEASQAYFGPVLGWAFIVMVFVCLGSFIISFIMSAWQQSRDYRSTEESWRRR